MQLNHNVKIGGTVNVCKKVGCVDVPAVEKPFENLILDAFFNRIYTGGSAPYSSIVETTLGIGSGTRAGTGTNAPAVSDTGLQNPVLVSNGANAQVTSSVTYDSINDEYVLTRTARTEYDPSPAEYNLSEIAIYTDRAASGVSINPIVSRTLIKNGLGEPTTITLTTSEILVIFYTFTCRVPRTVSASATIGGNITSLDFNLHYVNAATITDFPFIQGFKFGALGSSLLTRTTDFTMPAAFTGLSTAGWTSYPSAVTNETPLNPAVGLKQRSRVGLTSANESGIIGLSFSAVAGSHSRTCLLKASPSFSKTNLDVIDFETIVTFTRL